ncbi:lipopolysaccharide transport periplasmic protein LptA [Pelagovum pacificum]|uniref:Lipopolysaccharide transport periplasmic protein LptA n=1 Tax=Pelagovum pacificum TaxID=2588711 RepID=A0A5C5GHB7_9RHOB|nr:lipopolysaccharide transport periplasmic protein LptA [Pelagovum pacificum]QQA42864.1 lipopolysaccharide transport periplasmic protein LptA [Pelagovum pacificum]TNY33990.1 lipopolysaccharide transport periplasmic protein LptA [Pelagovum pacificum]
MKRLLPLFLLALTTVPAFAQTNVDLGGVSADPDAPVEVTADSLTVDRESGSAIFSGNVMIGQGDLRIAAAEVQVSYDETTGDVARLIASGGVTLVTAEEQAEAQNADYDLTSSELTLTGEVLLTQGQSALSAERMVVNLDTGAAQMDGRVRTVFRQDGQ